MIQGQPQATAIIPALVTYILIQYYTLSYPQYLYIQILTLYRAVFGHKTFGSN